MRSRSRFLAAVLPFGLAMLPTAVAGQSVSLHCRGPFELVRDGGWTFTFRPGPRQAGPAGENLEPGMCAFPDRGMRAGEPTRVSLSGGAERALPTGEDLTLEFVVQRLKLVNWEMTNTAEYVSFLSRGDYVTVLEVGRSSSAAVWLTGSPTMNPLKHVIPVREPATIVPARPRPPRPPGGNIP